MPLVPESRILTPNEIKNLNLDGHKLDDSKGKMYVLRFLFNDQRNQAADPFPFKIKTTLLDKLAKDAIGMPYIVPPYGKAMHVRGPDGKQPDTVEGLLKIQTDYTVGEIAATFRTPTNNVYGIIDIWPEFQGAITNNLIPPFTSPTLGNHKQDSDGVYEAEFLNIQAVPTSGYLPHLSGIQGVCKNGLKECMNELRPLGAAGHLKASRKNSKSFSNIILNKLKTSMVEHNGVPGTGDPPTEPEPESTEEVTNAEIKTAIEQVEVKVKEVQVEVEEIQTEVKVVEEKVEEVIKIEEKIIVAEETNAEVLKEVATVTEGVDETKVVEKVDETPAEKTETPPPVETTPPVVGAAGVSKQIVLDIQTKHNTLKKEFDAYKKSSVAKEAELKQKLRNEQAGSIVDRLIFFKKIKPEERDAEIKKYVELKENEQLVELTALDNTLKSIIPDTKKAEEVIGAYGLFSGPDLTGDNPTTKSNLEIIEARNK